jgi:hypothetical protein
MSRLPDLVRDSKLETQFHDDCTVHIHYDSNHASHERAIRRDEYWRQESRIGRGAYGNVWLERCIKGQKGVQLRAVKQIPLSGGRIQDAAYLRELEAIAKFSQRKVRHSSRQPGNSLWIKRSQSHSMNDAS